MLGAIEAISRGRAPISTFLPTESVMVTGYPEACPDPDEPLAEPAPSPAPSPEPPPLSPPPPQAPARDAANKNATNNSVDDAFLCTRRPPKETEQT